MPNRDTCEKLGLLLRSSQSIISCETVEEDRFRRLARYAAYELQIPFFEWSIVDGFKRDGKPVQDETANPVDALTFIRRCPSQAVFLLNDFVSHLNAPSIIRLFREVAVQVAPECSSILLCAPAMSLPPEISHMSYPFELRLPSKQDLQALMNSVVEGLLKVKKIKVDLSSADLNSMLSSLSGLTLRQARQILTYVILQDGILSAQDIEEILQRKAQLVHDSGVLDFFPVAPEALQIGGFKELKAWLLNAKVAFSDEARALNLPAPKGVLFVGVPGCGKSLSAKMIAREWRQPLLRLDAARLFDKYIGESERNFQKATKIAEAMAPCVFWIDEIEKLLGTNNGSSGADGGVGQRLFGAFLTWMQEKRQEVFLVATANDLSKLPAELLRKGRFDEIFFVDLPSAAERLEIFSIQLQSRKQDPSRFSLEALAKASHGFSGAEIEQLVNSAILRSLRLKTALTTEALMQEANVLMPLSRSRKEDIDQLRAMAKDRFRPVG